MKTQATRVKKLEQKVPPFERQFISWGGHPAWTKEEQAEAIRRHPKCRMFWPSLVETFPLPRKG